MPGPTFNCGEFKPGKKSIILSPIRPPVGGTLIPNPGKIIAVPGNGTAKPKGPGGPGNPGGPGTPGRGSQPGLPSNPKNPKGPRTGGPLAPSGIPSSGGPITPRGIEYYKCVDFIVKCPAPYEAITWYKDKKCNLCGNSMQKNLASGCPKEDQKTCKSKCLKTPPPPKSMCGPTTQQPTIGTVATRTKEPKNRINVITPNFNTNTIITPKEPNNTRPNRATLPKVSQPKINIIKVEESASFALSFNEDNGESLMSSDFNFFQYNTDPEDEQYVENNEYLHIFSNSIAREIKYILNHNGGDLPWKEYPYSQLTQDKILGSLNPQVLAAINSLHYDDLSQISVNVILDSIHKLLITNRLEEFDANYFINLAQRQSQDERVEFLGSLDPDTQTRAVLGVISQGALPSAHEKQTNNQQLQTVRIKHLHSDVEAALPVQPLDSEEFEIPSEDGGIPIYDEDVLQDYIVLGEGDNYYVSAVLGVDTGGQDESPVYISHAVSATFYPPPDIRTQALGLAGIDDKLRLSVTSVADQSEFDPAYDLSTEIHQLYFTLDLPSLGDLDRDANLIDSTSGTFNLVTDPEEILEHTRTYGYMVSRVNLDYRDPFLVYANDSSAINFVQKDITFRSVSPTRNNTQQSIIPRNIPQGLLLIAGQGSKHNPFSSGSELEEFEDSVSRSISLMPDINRSAQENYPTALDEKMVGIATDDYSIGLEGYLDSQNVFYGYNEDSEKYKLTYFSGSYASNTPNRERSEVGKFIKDLINDIIITKYDPDSVTWWDLYRRLNATQIATLSQEAPKRLLDSLAGGWQGFKVLNVLDRTTPIETGLGEDLSPSTTDKIIVNQSDRDNGTIYNA